MSESTTDELLQRVLDAEATAEERARVAADAQLAARLARMEEARAALTTPPPVLAPDQVDLLVGRALDAADPSAAQVVPLAPVAAQRRSRRPLVAAALSAAAALLLLALAVPLLRSVDTGDDADQSASPSATDDALEGADGGTTSDLGSYSDLDEVAAALVGGEVDEDADESFETDSQAAESADGDAAADAEEGSDSAAAPTTTVLAPSSAEAGPDDEPDLEPVPPDADPVRWCGDRLAQVAPSLTPDPQRSATLEWRGQPAVAFLVVLDGRHQVVVVSADDCALLAGPSPA